MTVNEGTAGRIAAVAVASATPVLYARWIRRRLLTWGANRDEVTRAWPGDELIPNVNAPDCTMAPTLPAPPEKVWPWLVLMGVGRAGWDHHTDPSRRYRNGPMNPRIARSSPSGRGPASRCRLRAMVSAVADGEGDCTGGGGGCPPSGVAVLGPLAE